VGLQCAEAPVIADRRFDCDDSTSSLCPSCPDASHIYWQRGSETSDGAPP